MTTSWGEKKFIIGADEGVILPRLCRKMSPLQLWKAYGTFIGKEGDQKLGRPSFYNIVKAITGSGQHCNNSQLHSMGTCSRTNRIAPAYCRYSHPYK